MYFIYSTFNSYHVVAFLSYSILALAGDVIAQSLLSEDEKKSFPPADWDKVRTAAFVAFGAIYTGGVSNQMILKSNI